jgi:hypothetical protein
MSAASKQEDVRAHDIVGSLIGQRAHDIADCFAKLPINIGSSAGRKERGQVFIAKAFDHRTLPVAAHPPCF